MKNISVDSNYETIVGVLDYLEATKQSIGTDRFFELQRMLIEARDIDTNKDRGIPIQVRLSNHSIV